MEDTISDTVAIIERAMRIGEGVMQERPAPDGNGYSILSPGDMKINRFPNPEHLCGHVSQQVTIEHPADLADYINVHKDKFGQTVVFADQASQQLVAILNYHTPEAQCFADHRASMKVRFDPIYADWRAINGIWQEQTDFAHFLEEHAQDIVVPEAASIVEIASSLEVKTEIDFKKAINLQNGNTELQFVERSSERTPGSIELPKQIVIKTPIYFGGVPSDVTLFFRHNGARGGVLKFKLDLHRWQYAERDAFLNIARQIATDCGVPVYLGKAVA